MREEIIKTAQVLQQGGTILYPTDTIWGIGCDATNYKAVEKVYAIKRRGSSRSFIVLLDQPEKIEMYVSEVPEIVWDLLSSVEEAHRIFFCEPERRSSTADLQQYL